MITLSNINISHVLYPRIDLAGIRLGVGGGGRGQTEFDPASFDQAWTVTGKTNEDSDRATIANLTGNGNDLVLSNFLFAENSGYGLYYQYFGKDFFLQNNVALSPWILNSNYSISQSSRVSLNSNLKCYWHFLALQEFVKIRFKLTGMMEGDVLAFGSSTNYPNTWNKDGIYIIDLPASSSSLGFSLQTTITEADSRPNTPVTIELLPFDYEGYLVTDGVDDKVVSSAFGLSKDWTIVGDWKFINDNNDNSGIVKDSQIFIYNSINRLRMYINRASSPYSVPRKSVKAICSDGRIYLDDWTEVIDNTEQSSSGGNTDIKIGFNATYFTQLAFKNLGIYNNRILSKEQCIQAYNYLQTLKNK